MWYKKLRVAFPTGDAPWHLHAVKETVTDTPGRFAMSAWRGIDWNPVTYVEVPQIVVYKPGYEPLAPGFASRQGFASFEDVEKALRHGTTIRLSKLSQQECKQAGLVTGLYDLGVFVDVPLSSIPNLLRLIDRQRARCGMQTFYREGLQRWRPSRLTWLLLTTASYVVPVPSCVGFEVENSPRDGRELELNRVFVYHVRDGKLVEGCGCDEDQRAVDEFWS